MPQELQRPDTDIPHKVTVEATAEHPVQALAMDSPLRIVWGWEPSEARRRV